MKQIDTSCFFRATNNRMKQIGLLIATMLFFNTSVFAIVATITATSGTNKTGSVNAAGVKNDGNMVNINFTQNRGYAYFNISSIPCGSIINSVNIVYTTYSTTLSGATNFLYLFGGDPSTISGTTLYNLCGGTGSTLVNSSSWAANTSITKASNAAGVTAVQNAAGTTICVGYQRGSTNNYNIYGYPGLSADQPKLVIDYTLPSTACVGLPSTPSISPSTINSCGSNSNTMIATGVSCGQNITYQWEVSSTGGGVGFAPVTGGVGANTQVYQTGTISFGTFYYRLNTVCTNSGLGSYSNEVTVVSQALPNVSASASATNYCSGAAANGLTATSTSTPTPTFSWAPGALTGATVNVTPTVNTIYTVTASTSAGCTSAATVSQIFFNGVSINATTASPSSICLGNTSMLNVTTNPNPYCTPNSLNFSSPFVYMSYVTIDSSFINNNTGTTPLPTPNGFSYYSSLSATLAAGSTHTLSVSGGNNPRYAAWIDYNNNGFFETSEYLGTSNLINWTPTFTVPAGAVNGETRMRVRVVYDFNNPLVLNDPCGLSDYGECEDYKIIITGGVPGFTYNWSPAADINPNATAPQNSNTARNPEVDMNTSAATTTFTVTVTNPGGCSNTGTATVFVADPNSYSLVAPVLTPASGVICNGKPIIVKDSVFFGGAPYIWTINGPSGNIYTSPGGYSLNYINQTINPSTSGVYTITVSDNCGASSVQTFSATVNPLPVLSVASSSLSFCIPAGPNVTLTATVSGGTGALTGVWAPSTGLSSASANPTVATPTAGTIYTYTATDAIGCTKTSTANVLVNSNPGITAVNAAPVAICSPGTTTLNVVTAPISYCIPNSTNFNFAFTYISNVTLGTINNTTGTTVAVAPNDFNYYNTISTNLTAGSAYTLSVTGGNNPRFAAWIDFNQNGVYEASEYLGTSIVSPWNPTFTVPATASNGQTRLRVRAVYDFSNPTVLNDACALSDYGECEDYAIVIAGGVPAFTYSWAPANNIAMSSSATIKSPVADMNATNATTTFTVTVANGGGCTITGTTLVNVAGGSAPYTQFAPAFTPNLGGHVCVGSNLTIRDTVTNGGAPFTFDIEGPTSGTFLYPASVTINPNFSYTYAPTVGGTYTIHSADGCGNSATQVFTVVIDTLPVVTASPSTALICNTGTSTLTGSGATTYAWMPGSLTGSPSVSPDVSTTYTVTGTNSNTCTGTGTVFVGKNFFPTFTSVTANPTSVCLNAPSVLNVTAKVITSGPAVDPGTTQASSATTSADEEIYIVTVNGASTPSTYANANGCTNAAPGAGSVLSRYSNFAPLGPLTTMTSGNTYSFSVGQNECDGASYFANGIGVWIDYNRDGDFNDANETIFLEAATAAATAAGNRVVNGSFVVPASATPGWTRMRFISAEGYSATGFNILAPGISYGYGETEDWLVNILAEAPIAPTGFTWSPPTYLPAVVNTNNLTTLPLSTAQTFSVTCSSPLGCTAVSSITVNVANGVVAGAITSSAGTSFCANISDTLTATITAGGSPFTYQWSNSAGALGTNVKQIAATSGTYSVVITDACNTTTLATISITVNPLPVLTIGANPTTVCYSGTSNLTASGASTYMWMPGALTGASVNPTITANRTFTVTGTDANGCTKTGTQAVAFEDFAVGITSSSSSTAICPSATVTLTAAQPTGPQTVSATYTPNVCGTTFDEEIYIVTVNGSSTPSTYANANGCTNAAPGPGSLLSQYSNFTTLGALTSMQPGGTYSWSVGQNECDGAAYYPNGIGVWIDFNRDGDFNDAGETIFQEASTAAATAAGNRVVSGTVTIPVTAALGVTRMRFISAEGISGASLTSTVNYNYGETEDWLVNINPIPQVGNTFSWSPMAASTNTVSVSPATTSSYTVTSTSLAGCSTTSSITLTVTPATVSATANPTIVAPSGSSTLTASGASSYAWASPAPSSLVSTTGNAVLAQPTVTSVYTVTGTSSIGCTTTTTVTVTVNNATLTLTKFDAGCFNQASGAINTATTNLSGTVTLSINPNVGSIGFGGPYDINALPAGTYTVTATNGTFSATASTVIGQPATAVGGTVSTTSPLCNGGTGSAIAVGSGGTPLPGYGYLYTWYNSSNIAFDFDDTANAIMGGVYSVDVEDLNGCIYNIPNVTINNPALLSISASASNALCNGSADGSISITATGGTGAKMYSLNNGTPQSSNSISGLLAGTYTLTVFDANGCSASTTAIVGQPGSLVASVSYAPISCNGGMTSVMTSATGGTAPYTGTGSVSYSAGTYTFSVSDANGCNGSTVSIITQPSAVSLSATATTIGCNGGTSNVTLITNGGTGSISTMPSTTTGLAAGGYTYTATDANGCTSVASVTITQPTALSLSLSATTILCNGNPSIITATPSGGSPVYYYGSTGTNTNNTFVVTASPPTYTIIVRDANNCSATSTINISQPSAISISGMAGMIACNGGTTSVSLTTSGGTGSIATSPSTTGLVAGTYIFTATDGNACTKTTSVIITQPTQVAITATAGSIPCVGSTGNVTLVTNGGTGAITTAPSSMGLLAGTYTFTATDANGCSNTASATLVNPAALVATVSANSNSIASGGSLVLTSMPMGMTNYSVAGPGGISNSSSSNVFTSNVVVANSGNYTVTVTNANGCTATTVININVFSGVRLALKTMLAGPYMTATLMMHDSLRALSLIPTTEPYSAMPYSPSYTHVNGGGGEVCAASVFTVTGANAIVDWVFLQLRSKLDSNIVVATRSALIQRDGDIVDVDGTSSVVFSNSAPDDYFIAVEHRNHLGVMTKGKVTLSSTSPTAVDLTTTTVPLFAFVGRAGNPMPLTGATRNIGGVRCLYAGNCNVELALNAYRYITYNYIAGGDRYNLFNATGGSSTINGYNVLDCDMNGYARFNGLNPDRLIIYQSCNNNNNTIVNEQTPN
jgi:GEVED domain/SprB repeat